MAVPLTILYAGLVVIGWSTWKDFKASIDNVKPQVRQAKQDAQDASAAADAAKKQIADTVAEANKQLQAVKNVNSKIAGLDKQITDIGKRLEELNDRVSRLQAAAAAPPPQGATPAKCEEVEVHVQAPPPQNFSFPDTRIGERSEKILGLGCSSRAGGKSEVRMTLTGPFYFNNGTQSVALPVSAAYFHPSIYFKPEKVGAASGTLTVSTDGSKVTILNSGNPATLTGTGQ